MTHEVISTLISYEKIGQVQLHIQFKKSNQHFCFHYELSLTQNTYLGIGQGKVDPAMIQNPTIIDFCDGLDQQKFGLSQL